MNKAPLTALILGWGGVIPFIGAAMAKIFGGPITGIYALSLGTLYAGVIITFIGAIHWGAAVQNPKPWRLIWSILPALAVVPVLFIAPALRIPFLIAGLMLCWAVDFRVTKEGVWPEWYMKLRHGLTGTAVISLIILGSV